MKTFNSKIDWWLTGILFVIVFAYPIIEWLII